MYLIAGLGNPGRSYEKNRHNVGFMLLDRIAETIGQSFRRFNASSQVISGILAENRVVLLKPMTYMNSSGSAVREVQDYFNIPIEKCLIVYDEIALPLGRIRFRNQGSAGGHRGMGSVIEFLATKEVPRLRIGILGDTLRQELADYVLSDFKKQEQEILSQVLSLSIDGVECFIRLGIEKTMAQFNYHRQDDQPEAPSREEN